MAPLIIYYSWSGNTRRVAELIQKETDGDLFEIEPAVPYTDNYNDTVKQAKKEIQQDYKPVLKSLPDVTGYETVFVGTPNWWSTMAPPVATLLSQTDFTGKTVVPFSTHGGGGEASCGRDIARLSQGAEILKSYTAYQNNTRAADISAWLTNLKGVKNG